MQLRRKTQRSKDFALPRAKKSQSEAEFRNMGASGLYPENFLRIEFNTQKIRK